MLEVTAITDKKKKVLAEMRRQKKAKELFRRAAERRIFRRGNLSLRSSGMVDLRGEKEVCRMRELLEKWKRKKLRMVYLRMDVDIGDSWA